ACLVSLESLEEFLPDNENGGPPIGSTFHGDRLLRLAVLKSWQFFSTGQPATFRDQLLALNGRDPRGETDAVNTNLRLDYKGSNAVIGNALAMGYVPLNSELRTAEKTVSWYRGPLAPYAIPESKLEIPIRSPDQATVFDPTTGMFDVSLASAWTIGRMIALQDTAFSTALYNWKKGLSMKAVNSVEEDILNEKFAAILAPGPIPAAMTVAMEKPEEAPASKTLLHRVMQLIQKPVDSQ
ncbi:MAG: hypothetical protein KDM63_08915, partial [Verrucomicrobiae bacterium]|nr:hypothetical protein [Verrucomicrobiae bacterium]